ncbi:hypothetical protein [Microbacterium capsulatum]|uniref:Uncharacterized protein n=1 Tax=Microbacterium capsulatum TaxID=3041921 RepID=A0ABU0XJU5_9MICO|nr:hypothetical protein [Microbacterium sp. ASV81]MDQ4215376.1 hypothetical protein [Microbacterium sp. ASV81]
MMIVTPTPLPGSEVGCGDGALVAGDEGVAGVVACGDGSADGVLVDGDDAPVDGP